MFKLKRYDSGVWIPYPKMEGVEFKIRPVSSWKATELRHSVRRKVAVKDPDGKILFADDTDINIFSLKLFDWALEDVKGIEFEGIDKDKDPRWKEMIYEIQELRDFISDESEKLRLSSEEEYGKEIKNSKSSPSGS